MMRWHVSGGLSLRRKRGEAKEKQKEDEQEVMLACPRGQFSVGNGGVEGERGLEAFEHW